MAAMYSHDMSESIIRAMSAEGMSNDEIAAVIGEDVAFINAAGAGKRGLSKAHAQRLISRTGTSADEWALRGLDRSTMTSEQSQFVVATRELVGQLSAMTDQLRGKASPKRVHAKSTSRLPARRAG